MNLTIGDICSCLQCEQKNYQYFGKESLMVTGYCSLNNIKPNSITWIKHIDLYDITKLSKEYDMLIVTEQAEPSRFDGYNVIVCANPKEIFFGILEAFFAKKEIASIESDSYVETTNIGKNVSIGHHCHISKNVVIGDDVVIHDNVIIKSQTVIGSRTIINAGVVIGTDGYGYYTDSDGKHHKVPHFGGVTIGSDVEIGANTCIDRGTLDNTIIGNNVKIDNLCHIAHNVQIGNNVLLIALSMIAGSAIIQNNVYIAPCAAIMNQIVIEEDAFIGMGAVVTKNVEKNKVVTGFPARTLRDNKQYNVSMNPDKTLVIPSEPDRI